MYLVTFYSYKGGVGRTLALMNTAARLAWYGKKVFVLDFDLEAPGIDAFEHHHSGQQRAGVVEYISEYLEHGVVGDLRKYVFESDINPGRGKIFVMPAGRKDTEYQQRLSRLDWKLIYQEKHGFALLENLKGAISATFSPDYVLVDSRTGLTDISGICTIQLPHLVVIIFNLNTQNIEGASHIARSIRNNRAHRNIETLLVASPIPDVPNYVRIRQERLREAELNFGAPVDLIVPFDPFVAFEETILMPDGSPTYLSKSYDQLAKKIISRNTSDVITVLDGIRQLRAEGNLDVAELRVQELIETNPNREEVWLELGVVKRIRGDLPAATMALERARYINPRNALILSQLALVELAQGRRVEAERYLNEFLAVTQDKDAVTEFAQVLYSREAYDLAFRAFTRLNELAETAATHVKLGQALMPLGDRERALAHYIRAAELESTHLAAVYNAGFILSEAGDPAGLQYFLRAIDLFEKRDISLFAPPDRANMLQAISNAYKAAGRVHKARECLEEALGLAYKLTKTRIFSSTQYKQISPEQFVEETRRMLDQVSQETHKHRETVG